MRWPGWTAPFAAGLFSVVAAVGTVGAGEPSVSSVPEWNWNEPGCIAWSPREKSYACIRGAVSPAPSREDRTTDLAVVRSVASQRDYDPPEPTMHQTWKRTFAVGARGEVGLEFLGDSDREEHVYRENADGVCRIDANADRLREALADGGYVREVERRKLPESEWVEWNGVAYRFRTTFGMTGASFETRSHLDVRCSDEAEPKEVFPDTEFRGPTEEGPPAVLSAAEGTSRRVLTVEEHDGGEGWVSVAHSSWAFDRAAFCGAH